jgi:Lrp/AsnC family leucine-responsive transcriptional regulator
VVVIVPDLAAYDAFCDACLLHDANVRSFTTHVVLEAARRGGPVAIGPG